MHYMALCGAPMCYVKDYLFEKANDGTTVAHLYAINNELPTNFPFMSYSNKNDETVGHIAAYYGNLPWDISLTKNQWAMSGVARMPLAHYAVIGDCLPHNFAHWDIKDSEGVTTLTLKLRCGIIDHERFDDADRAGMDFIDNNRIPPERLFRACKNHAGLVCKMQSTMVLVPPTYVRRDWLPNGESARNNFGKIIP